MSSCCLVKESAGTQRSSPIDVVVVVIVTVTVSVINVTNEEGKRECTVMYNMTVGDRHEEKDVGRNKTARAARSSAFMSAREGRCLTQEVYSVWGGLLFAHCRVQGPSLRDFCRCQKSRLWHPFWCKSLRTVRSVLYMSFPCFFSHPGAIYRIGVICNETHTAGLQVPSPRPVPSPRLVPCLRRAVFGTSVSTRRRMRLGAAWVSLFLAGSIRNGSTG
ncbi:unnamed protein product, partial [Ectocarpus sp. 12 AP-2014]